MIFSQDLVEPEAGPADRRTGNVLTSGTISRRMTVDGTLAIQHMRGVVSEEEVV